MILIADSGSTNTRWCFTDGDGKDLKFTTSGINPFFRDSDSIFRELKKDLIPKLPGKVKSVFYYGAGVVNQKLGSIVKEALSQVFPDAVLEVESDLLAAARSTLKDEKGIACILGTGANSCLYDGIKIIEHIPPLGYILGDEGSGTFLGKRILADYLKNIMPKELSEKFREMFRFDYLEFLNNVYRNENVRKFLAGFVPFLKQNIEKDYCRIAVEEAFEAFIDRNIFRYPDYKEVQVCFVGSVGFIFQEQLRSVMKRYNLKTGLILKEPLESLVHYHSKNTQS